MGVVINRGPGPGKKELGGDPILGEGRCSSKREKKKRKIPFRNIPPHAKRGERKLSGKISGPGSAFLFAAEV